MTLPGWLEPLFDAEGMRATDRWAIEERGMPSLDLMERAGEGLAAVIARQAPGGRVAIVCGKGNNGGDGLVAARLLRQAGRAVDVLAVWPPDTLRGDAAEQLQRLPGEPPVAFDGARLEGVSVVVDALLGTGSTGEPRGEAAEAIQAMTAADVPVVAADIPSGVDASTGEMPGVAVRAAATATFHAAKIGLWIHPGKAHAGQVEVVDIGIPPGGPAPPPIGLLTRAVLGEVPRRGIDSTKFSSGAVDVLGGSSGLTGAPTMTAMAAIRAGAGYVTVLAPASLQNAFSLRLLEAMTAGLPEEDGSLTPAAVEPALERLRRAAAAALGPGLGREPGARAFARELVSRIGVPLVIDADGLNALAEGFPRDLPDRRAPTVLTPHAGELGRLLAIESDEIGRRRLAHARGASERAGAIVVLKGDDTLIAHPGGTVAVSPGGAPALATAGTGDVLSGVIGAMLAKNLRAFTAVCAAVFLHLRAGQLAAAPHGPDGVIASDVIAALPAALNT
ncbi:MAG TPA: NAD(P)H-hydrate dehydratase [Solirubrobacteraceae bacterium]|jgi:ADP-dependent NAD(P)H-hydrate dehydratase / NAD(P)H-hydrate epimerase|nr:NAD(P)H-hydrate dehydratase [Solirubrobacteraceae bacterium]